jgi:hypothetical protein
VGTRFHGATPSGGWPMTLALDRGTVIAGRVRRTDGSSPKGWILSVARKREGTRYTASHYLPADGTFRFKDVPNEPLQLHVVRDSERDAIFDATAGRTDVDLVVP